MKTISDDCPDGQQLMQNGQCGPCVQGTYRNSRIHKQCQNCPTGLTTSEPGATQSTHCNIPRCNKGEFLVKSSRKCELCARGYYQDEETQVECKRCDVDYNTRQPGAKAKSECYNTNQCTSGVHKCHWHAICTDKVRIEN